MSSEYEGRRLGDGPAAKPGDPDYDGRHLEAQAKAGPGGLFYDPFSAWAKSEDAEENEGEAFNIKKGRHEALLEGVFSSEIDGGVIETLAPKKKRGKLFAVLLALILLVVGVGAFTLGKEAEAPPTDGSTLPSLVTELEPTYPNFKFTQIATTFAVEGKVFKSSSGSTLKSPYAATGSAEGCRLVSVKAFCVVGTVAVPNFPAARVFSTTALITSATFSELIDYTAYESGKDKFRGQAVVDFANAPTRFLLFMDGKDGDGWFVEVPLDIAPEDLKTLADSFTYEP